MSNLSFAQTADGSQTIYNAEVGEYYHSRHGALQESRHVFLHSGLRYFLEKDKATAVKVLEVGFGTGLNFLLSADYCLETNIQLHYTGIEAYPLPSEMISKTGYEEYVKAETWSGFLNNYSGSFVKPVRINRYTELEISPQKLMDFTSETHYDVIFFDAFAATYQPEMWTTEALSHICSFMKQGGVFVTYAITGNLKRSMKALGFSVEKAQGAPGKREMLRAVKL